MTRIRPNVTLSSFEVNCFFSEFEVSTEIPVINQSDKGFVFPANESDKCDRPECFSQTINYLPKLEQIEVLFYNIEFKYHIDQII